MKILLAATLFLSTCSTNPTESNPIVAKFGNDYSIWGANDEEIRVDEKTYLKWEASQKFSR